MNLLDRSIALFDPARALRRQAARQLLAHYEADKPTIQRKLRKDGGSANRLVGQSAVAIRNQARYLERNHDVVTGIIRTLVNNTVGASGIGIEFQPRNRDGDIDKDYATALTEAFTEWCRRPEVTWMHSWSDAQRLLARGMFVDGEAMSQHLIGPVAGLDHGTRVPYSLELLEADLVPHAYNDGANIRQGIYLNAWGRPVTYYVYKGHPGDIEKHMTVADLKQIPASSMIHLAIRERMHQVRGMSVLHSVITRLEDIKDYEESERIAAKIAARLTAYLRKGGPDSFDAGTIEKDKNGNPKPRDLEFDPGTIIDGLMPGEEIGIIDSKRPNPNVVTFRQGQLRAVAAGVGASYSSVARDYSGSYSSQRQEMVEQYVNYATLTDMFTSQAVQPVVTNFVLAAHLSGIVPMPKSVPIERSDECLFIAQSMPWIDPLKEANAWRILVRAGFASEVEVLRKRGINPAQLLSQVRKFREEAADLGLKFDSDIAQDQALAAPVPTESDPNADGSDPAPGTDPQATMQLAQQIISTIALGGRV